MSDFISDEEFNKRLQLKRSSPSGFLPPIEVEAPQSEGSGCSFPLGQDAMKVAPVVSVLKGASQTLPNLLDISSTTRGAGLAQSSLNTLSNEGATELQDTTCRIAVSTIGQSILSSEPKASDPGPITSICNNIELPPGIPYVVNKEVAAPAINSSSSTSSPLIEFDGLDIKDPVELLLLLDENILSGDTKLHDWQIQFMLDFANPAHTKSAPFRAAVQACNSSGKDKYVIAACAVWICMRYKEVECPITSSSGDQLDNQTGQHIDRLCHKANAVLGQKYWKIQYRYYEFLHTDERGNPTPSKLKLFATDEPGKAEGYHPVDKGKKMAIFTSETKSIPASITGALTRCIGYTHRVDASSPGLAAGYFYEICTSGVPREEIDDIKSLVSVQTILYHITAHQCSHITEEEIEAFASSLPGGKNNQVYKSGIDAEFGSTDMMVVIPSQFVWRAVADLPKRKKPFKIEWIKEVHNKAGLDLSDGGAETVLAIRNGNKLIGLEAFKLDDTNETIDYLVELFNKWHLTHKDATINGDYCGLGGPMLTQLKKRLKWTNVKFIDSRNSSSRPKTYSNRGTELFFNFKELLGKNEVILFYDKLLIDQLCTRYYKLSLALVHQLLSKLEQKAKGYPSPDRADAVNLAFWDYKSTVYQSGDVESPFEDEKEVVNKRNTKVEGDFDMKVWAGQSKSAYKVEHIEEQDLDDFREQLKQYNKQRRVLIGNK